MSDHRNNHGLCVDGEMKCLSRVMSRLLMPSASYAKDGPDVPMIYVTAAGRLISPVRPVIEVQ